MSLTSSILGLTLPEIADADWLNSINTSFSKIQSKIDSIDDWPSGLPVGTAKGRIVCIGPGTGGTPTVYLAFANPAIGNEYRRRPIGIAIETAPALDANIKVVMLGYSFVEHKFSVASTAPSIGGPGDTIPELPSVYGKPAYLKNGTISDPDTLGFVTDDPAQSLGYGNSPVILGVFLPTGAILVRPRLQVEV